MTGKFAFALSEGDYASFNRRLFLKRCGIGALVGLAVVAAALLVTSNMVDPVAYLSGIVGGVLVAPGLLFFVSRNAKRIYRDTPTMWEQRNVTFDADGFEIEQKSGTFRSSWADINQWTSDKHAMALWLNRAMMILIPKTLETAAPCDEMAALLINSGLVKNKRRNRT